MPTPPVRLFHQLYSIPRTLAIFFDFELTTPRRVVSSFEHLINNLLVVRDTPHDALAAILFKERIVDGVRCQLHDAERGVRFAQRESA